MAVVVFKIDCRCVIDRPFERKSSKTNAGEPDKVNILAEDTKPQYEPQFLSLGEILHTVCICERDKAE